MGSLTKFPSGLNNWVDSDKPVRTDFVTDNEILDQNAMWKDDYDATGVVAQSGGIEAYALDRDTYDLAGSVAMAGGIMGAIQTAVFSNEGYSLYLHSKSGNVHTLTNPAGGSVMRFIATADYVDGDIFVVNGTACAANAIDGSLIADKFFVSDTVVSCFLNGAQLNFKGGGTRLNYTIVGGTTKPSSPKENTLWINTSIPITNHVFYPTQPAGVTGRAWIKIDSASTLVMDNLIKTSFVPGSTAIVKEIVGLPVVSAQIYNGTTWVNVGIELYLNGAWRSGKIALLTSGLVNAALIGGFTAIVGSTAIIQNSGYIRFATQNNGNQEAVATTVAVNATGFSTIRVDISAGTNISGYGSAKLHINNGRHITSPLITQGLNFSGTASPRAWYSLNVTNINQPVYIIPAPGGIVGGGVQSWIDLYNIEIF